MPDPQFELPTELQNFDPEDLMTGRALPPAMLVDLLRIASLGDDQIASVSEIVGSQKQIVTPEEIERTISSKLGEDLGKGVTKFVLNFDPTMVERVLHILQKLREAKPKAAEIFDEAKFEKIKNNLNRLVQGHSSIELIRKSQNLLRALGNEIESVTFICDLRPVFDKEHEKVEGLISVAGLKLGFKDQEDDENSIEFALSEGDLDYLMERCEDAKKKLAVLKREYVSNALITESGDGNE